jgi:hypothetical protein
MSACQHLPGYLCTGAAVPLAETLSFSLTHSVSLYISHLLARAGSLAPAGMSDNTVVAEYAVCDLRPSIPVITDGPDREIYLVYTRYIPWLSGYVTGAEQTRNFFSLYIPVIWTRWSYVGYILGISQVYTMYIYGMQHWWPFCIAFRGHHHAIPDASPRDISYPDPNDNADFDVSDQQA